MNSEKKKNLIALLFFIFLFSVVAGVFVYQPTWEKISDFRPWKLGLDLSGGSYLVYDIDLSDVDSSDHGTVMNGLRDVIEKRVNLFGISEPRVYTQKINEENRLIVELAGIKSVDSAISEIGATPVLDFREVSQEFIPEVDVKDVDIIDNATSSDKQSSINVSTSSFFYTKTDLTGRYVKGSQLGFSQYTNEPLIYIEFTKEGAKLFEEITARNIGQPLAIFLDNDLLTQPTVQQKIIGGKAQITGKFTRQEAQKMVERFNAGALPAPVKLINQQTVNATLGQDSLNKSIKAGIWGFLAIILFMIVYYKKLGLVASASLLMYVTLVLGIYKIIPVTLTLSGIAGFILSIGIAVDANILVFERMKEELDRGLIFSHAVEEGFHRAWSSIRDSNITTIISCVILFYFTSGFIQGFALTLLIGVLVSMFSAITITRTILRIFAKKLTKS